MCNGGNNRRQTGEAVYVESWSISNAQPRIQDVKSNRRWSPCQTKKGLHFGKVPLGWVELECIIGSESGNRETS